MLRFRLDTVSNALDATANDAFYRRESYHLWLRCPVECFDPEGSAVEVMHHYPAQDIRSHSAELWVNELGVTHSLCGCGAYVDTNDGAAVVVYHERHERQDDATRKAADTAR